MKTEITECQRCGTCCRKGGPALHHEDKELLLKGQITHMDLVTVRNGEPAYTPISDSVTATDREIVKIKGQGSDWVCGFLEQLDNSCRIYEQRPLECRLQQCWDNQALLELVGKDTITRRDIINPSDPINEFIDLHDRECPCDILQSLSGAEAGEPAPELMSTLTELVKKDLNLRSQVSTAFKLPVETELFLFGRPLFVILSSYGLELTETDGDIRLSRRQT